MLIKPTINVLVVVHDIGVMHRCRELLLDEGHRVRTAESVEEALDIVQKHPAEVDVMLLSLGFPKNGSLALIETLQKARPDSSTEQIPDGWGLSSPAVGTPLEPIKENTGRIHGTADRIPWGIRCR